MANHKEEGHAMKTIMWVCDMWDDDEFHTKHMAVVLVPYMVEVQNHVYFDLEALMLPVEC